jgi:hypothetical protein
MRTLKEILADLRERATKMSVFAILLVLYAAPADNQGRLEWWGKLFHKISPYLFSATGKICIFFLAVMVIYLDQRRITARIGKPHPKSLQGRCLKVRDEMQRFLDSLGEKQKGFLEGETQVEYITRASAETGRRWELLGHYYELNCASEVENIYHEFGVRGLHEVALERGEFRSRKKEEDYKFIIDALSKLAETPEAKIKPRLAPLR